MPAAQRNNLPPYPTRFIGRAADLRDLLGMLSRERLVTILGPPGVGKTRLAIECASRLTKSGEAWLCDLSEAEDIGGACAALGRVLGVPLGAGESPGALLAKLGDALSARGPALLLLDGFDRLAAHAGALLDAWREAAPEARFLITSRERLGLPG